MVTAGLNGVDFNILTDRFLFMLNVGLIFSSKNETKSKYLC